MSKNNEAKYELFMEKVTPLVRTISQICNEFEFMHIVAVDCQIDFPDGRTPLIMFGRGDRSRPGHPINRSVDIFDALENGVSMPTDTSRAAYEKKFKESGAKLDKSQLNRAIREANKRRKH